MRPNPNPNPNPNPLRVFVTGTSSGFGELIVRRLRGRGHAVCASMRDVADRNADPAAALAALGAHVVEMDVTRDDDVARAVDAAAHAMDGLDVIVNNAAVGVVGLQEAFTVDDIAHVFDVNVLGVCRVNRRAIPIMRAGGRGLLINISSLLGRMVMPFYGPYIASKWALEALTETWRYELAGLGIDACLVEPGAFATRGVGSLMRPSDPDRAAAYGPLAGVPLQMCEGLYASLVAHPEQVPSRVAEAVVELIETPAGRRPLRTTVDTTGLDTPVKALNAASAATAAAVLDQMGLGAMIDVVAARAKRAHVG